MGAESCEQKHKRVEKEFEESYERNKITRERQEAMRELRSSTPVRTPTQDEVIHKGYGFLAPTDRNKPAIHALIHAKVSVPSRCDNECYELSPGLLEMTLENGIKHRFEKSWWSKER